jgi:23S rRNA pseudouridine1911/1915/1917 synthase
VAKEYLAIVKGGPEWDSFVVDAPLGKCPHSQIRLKMSVVQMGADGEPLFLPKSEILPSSTAVEVVERVGDYSVVRCIPHTGRQHQIRVHLHHVGHPIVGDKLYGPGDDFFLRTMRETVHVEVEPGIELTRHALHAHKLAFRHPSSGKFMEFTSPLPTELDEFLQKVRK